MQFRSEGDKMKYFWRFYSSEDWWYDYITLKKAIKDIRNKGRLIKVNFDKVKKK